MRAVGIDVGYGHTKVVFGGYPVIFPSLVGPSKDINFSLGKRASAGDVVEWRGQGFFVGAKALHSDIKYGLTTRDWIKSDMYAALLLSAFKRVTEKAGDINEAVIVTGLPVDYIKDASAAEAMVREVCASIGINVIDLKIIPQPIGSFFHVTLDGMGNLKDDAPNLRRMGIIDIGYNTTDFILLEDCEESIERAAGSIPKGASDVYSLVSRELKSHFQRNDVSIEEAEEAVRTRFFKSGGQANDVSELVNTTLSQLGKGIQSLIVSKWKTEGEIDKVLLTGGGCVLLRPYLSDMSAVTEMVPGPQIANARGYYKRAVAIVNAMAETRG